MKRIIAALSLGLLAAPVFAADVGVPQDTGADTRMQQEQGQPNGGQKHPVNPQQQSQILGPAPSPEATGVWAHDPNFIAPPP
jgi:hypothetical protein